MKVDYVKATDWVRNNWKGPSECPICQSDKWRISDDIVEIRQFHGQSFSTGGDVYPFLQIFCQSCGYTIFFNAVIAGLVDPQVYGRKASE